MLLVCLSWCYHQIVNTGSGMIKMAVSYFKNGRKPISHEFASGALMIVAQPAYV